MQAVHQYIPPEKHYYRHHVRDLPKTEVKCTYSDEKHRHRLGKEFLQELRCIKVPTVCKFPPRGIDGPPMVLEEAQTVRAFTVHVEWYFFETEDGQVKWSKKNPSSYGYHTVRADVAFFDERECPILLIELAETHKVDDDKKARLRLLGIDTVEVALPKVSAEEIREAFTTSEHTKWLYNAKEHTTEYVQPSRSNSGGVSRLDEVQRDLLEEAYTCRKSRLGNLIRSIERCLESEQYRSTEERFRTDLSRAQVNTRRATLELQRVRERCRRRVEGQYGEALEKLVGEERQTRVEFESLERRSEDLESRYRTKREELEVAERELRDHIQQAQRNPDNRRAELEEQARAHLKNT